MRKSASNQFFKARDNSLILLIVSCLIFSSTSLLHAPSVKSRSDYLVPPTILKNLTAGLSAQSADSFWLRAVQDFDFCDQPVNTRECKSSSWLFQIVDMAIELDTKFLEAYFYGGLALTVLVNDFEGASKVFDKGVKMFPDNWNLVYAAAYHALYEEKNKLKASKLYLMAAEKGAPAWTRVLAGRLAKEGGDNDFSKLILEQMISTSQDKLLVERLKEKLQQVGQ